MFAQVEKSKESGSKSVANSMAQKKSGEKQGLEYVNNRPGTAQTQKLKEMADNSPKVKQLSAISDLQTEPHGDSEKHVVQCLKIVGPDSDSHYRKADDMDKYPIETNNLGWPGMMDLLDELIASNNFALINDIFMDMPFQRLQTFYNSVETAHTDDHAQKYNLIRLFYNNRRPSNTRVSLTPQSQAMFAPKPSEPDISNLTEVEPWHEDALDNTRQGITNTALNRRQKKKPDATIGEDMDDFMSEATPLRDHLIAVRNEIISGDYLVRRISVGESDGWSMSELAADPQIVFMKGKESMKAFVVDGEYSFKDKDRDKDEAAYAVILRIRLTPKLKTYFLNFLYANMKNMMGAQFTFNPQFKFEQGGVTILIPKAGWEQFMSFVGGNYEILTPSGADLDDGSASDDASMNTDHSKSKKSHREPRSDDQYSQESQVGDSHTEYNLTAIRDAAQTLLDQGRTPEQVHRELHDSPEFRLPHAIIERALADLGHRDYL